MAEVGNVSIVSGLAVTHGVNSDAVVGVTDFGGDIYINSNEVFTYGAASQGIHAHAHEYGNVNVYNVPGEIETLGTAPRAYGVFAAGVYQGTTNITSGYVFTYGTRAHGIVALGLVTATSMSATTVSSTPTACRPTPSSPRWSTVSGDVVANYGEVAYAEHGVGVLMEAAGNATLNNHGQIYGGYVGVVSVSAATLDDDQQLQRRFYQRR